MGDDVAIYAALATVSAIAIGAATALLAPILADASRAHRELRDCQRLKRTVSDTARPQLQACASELPRIGIAVALVVSSALVGWGSECWHLMVDHPGLLLPFGGIVLLAFTLVGLSLQTLWWGR